jgi:hypothetical protein
VEVAPQRVVGDLRDLSGELDAAGPPPTTTNVSQSRRRWASVSSSAASKALRIRRRISIASSSVFSPGAAERHSSWPKYVCRAPAATTSLSYSIACSPSRSPAARLEEVEVAAVDERDVDRRAT